MHERTGTAIIFSDSAFFALDDIDRTFEFARTLMYELVYEGVPVRMGIAHGSFKGLRFANDTSAPSVVHMSQFLGTGVVRAYKTEHCGLPGIRAFLHPNLNERLDEIRHRVVPVMDPPDNLKVPVRFELNYLDPSSNYGGPDYDDVLIFDEISIMHGEAPKDYDYHYQATFHALNVMRAQLGAPPYPPEKYANRDKYQHDHGIKPEAYDASKKYLSRIARRVTP